MRPQHFENGVESLRRRLRCLPRTATIAFCVRLLTSTSAFAAELPAKVTYADHVQPILRQHCFACHGPDKQKNDLALNSYASAMKGGASGEVLVATDPDASYLWQLVNHNAEPAMPPGGGKLSQAELDMLRAWIAGGLLEQGDSTARKSTRAAIAAITPTTNNQPAGEPAMPVSVLREPVLHAAHRGAATAIAASPWAPLAALGAPFQVSLYEIGSGELLGLLPFVEGTPFVLRFSRDGSLLLAAGGQPAKVGLAALFDVKTGRRLATIGDELDAVMAADLSVDHSLVALGGPRKIVRVYRASDGSVAYEISKHTDWITAIEFSPDGKYLATADRGGALWLWDAPTGRELGELRGHSDQVTAVTWRDDSAMLASASEDDTVRLWQPEGQQIKSWNAHGGGALCVQFSHDGRLVTAGRDQRVKTWKPDGAAERDVAGMDDVALAARFTHNGERIIASDWAGNVRMYDPASPEAFVALDPNPPTLEAREAALITEVDAARIAAKGTTEELAAAESQLVAAQKALDEARTRVEQVRQRHTEGDKRLSAAEERLAALAEERAAAARAAEALAAQMVALQSEMAAAEAAAETSRKQFEDAEAAKDQQQTAIDAVAAQVAKLQESLAAARGLFESLASKFDERQQEQMAAQNRVDQLQAQQNEIKRLQQEAEAIEKLRAEHAE